jgi:Kef-type K+ transport system membrane component KefB
LDNPVLSFFVILSAAVMAPIVADLIPKVKIPVVVLEIALGVIIGPQILGWAEVNSTVYVLGQLGLAFLFFLAGYEIDFNRIKGKPLKLAITSWLVGLLGAFLIAIILRLSGIVTSSFLYVGLAIATTALGALLPMLGDAGELDTEFGTHTLAYGALIVSHHAFQRSTRPPIDAPDYSWLYHLGCGIEGGLFIRRFRCRDHCGAVCAWYPHNINQHNIEALHAKNEGLGYGFLIPIFFIVSGINFDMHALLKSPSNLILLPIFLILFFVVRGLPALWFYSEELPRFDRLALGFFISTQLELVIAITELGVESSRMTPVQATTLVGIAMLSVFLYPLLGFAMRRKSVLSNSSSKRQPIKFCNYLHNLQ